MITTVFAGSNARMVESSSSSYSSALDGAGLSVNTDETFNIGQYKVPSGPYNVRQYFSEYNYAAPSGHLPVFAFWRFYNVQTWGTNVYRILRMRLYDYGASVDTSDWRNPDELYSLQHVGDLNATQRSPNGRWITLASNNLWREFSSSSLLRTVAHTDRNQNGSAPSDHEQNTYRGASYEGTSYDPQVIVGNTTEHLLNPLISAQIQLSTGDWIVYERDDLGPTWRMTIKRIDTEGVEHVIDYVDGEGDQTDDTMHGAESVSMCCDNDDNFYVVDGNAPSADRFRIRIFKKTATNTWKRLAIDKVFIPQDDHRYDIVSTNVVFHNVGGGRLFIAGYRHHGAWLESDSGTGTQNPWALVKTQVLLHNESGSALVESGAMGRQNFTSYVPMWGYPNPVNPLGSVFDIVKDPEYEQVGFIISAERHAVPGSTDTISIGRYGLQSSGDGIFFQGTFAENDDSGGRAVYDPDAKGRVISTSYGRFIKITADDRTDWGLTLDSIQADYYAQSFVKTSTTRMDTEAVASLPDGPTLGTSQAWDAVYFPVEDSVWIYYFDDADHTRLMRTSFSVTEGNANRDEVVVNDTSVASGDTVHAIRVQRTPMVGDYVLISMAVEDSGGSHRVEYIVDWINIQPTQPLLDSSANFDSDFDYSFSWTFSDPNAGDEQTAYRVQYVDSTTQSIAHDTGKVVSGDESYLLPSGTLPNNEDYQWRVKVWDLGDYESPWSSYDDFSTSNTGVVSITFPSVDNEEIFIKDIPLTWDLTNATQEEYKVVVTRVDDNSVFLDTGWVTSSTQEHLVEEILSDVQYLFEVTTRNNLVESNTASRLVFTHYSTPETPVINTDQYTTDPYLNIEIINPTPRGDRPEVTVNEVWRRRLGVGGVFKYVGSTGLNSTFRDYTAASGEHYEYKVRGAVEA